MVQVFSTLEVQQSYEAGVREIIASIPDGPSLLMKAMIILTAGLIVVRVLDGRRARQIMQVMQARVGRKFWTVAWRQSMILNTSGLGV